MSKVLLFGLVFAFFLFGCSLNNTDDTPQNHTKSVLRLRDYDSEKLMGGSYAIVLCNTTITKGSGSILKDAAEIVETGWNQTCIFYGWNEDHYTGMLVRSAREDFEAEKMDIHAVKKGLINITGFDIETLENPSYLKNSTLKTYLITLYIAVDDGYYRKANVCYDWTSDILEVHSAILAKGCVSKWKSTTLENIYTCDSNVSELSEISFCNELLDDNNTCRLGTISNPKRLENAKRCDLLELTWVPNQKQEIQFIVYAISLDENSEINFMFFDSDRDIRGQNVVDWSISWKFITETSDGVDVGAQDVFYKVLPYHSLEQ